MAVFGENIVIGQVAPATGKFAQAGRDYHDGIRLYFEQVNAKGGVNGHTLQLVRRDDNSVAEETVKLTKRLLAEDKPVALIGYVGTENVRALARDGVLKKERIPLIGVRSGEATSEPFFYHVKAGLRNEVATLLRQAALTSAEPRIALLYDPGFADAETIRMVEDMAGQLKLKLVSKFEYKKGAIRVADLADQIVAAKPRSLLVLTDGVVAGGFVDSFSASGEQLQMMLTSETDVEVLMQRLGNEQARGVVIAQVLPSPYAATRKLTREFQAAASKATELDIRVSYTSLEGYIAAKVLVEAIRRAGPKASRATIAAALDSLGEVDLGGYVVEFQPGKREGSKFVELSIVNKHGKLTQ